MRSGSVHGTTLTNGKFNSRAVIAFHLASATSCLNHCTKGLAGVLYRTHHEKQCMRNAIAAARAARLSCGIYKPGDFHPARLV